MTYEDYSKIRDLKGFKDREVALGAGFAPSTFSDWKSGRSCPKNEKLKKIADFFGMTMAELTGLNEDPSFKAGVTDYKLMGKINKLNDANRTLLENMIDTMLSSQN